MKIMNYDEFIQNKSQLGINNGFEPLWIPETAFDFQKMIAEWSIRSGRCAVFADCGLGKTLMQLIWAANVAKKTGRRVLILTPLAVGPQTEAEAVKFNVDAKVSRDGKLDSKITIANYQRLHYFKPEDFAGVVCDESSILKNFDGVTKEAVTEFMRMIPYRSLYTATAAPNDYIELGTSSEALGHLGFMDMLNRFFKKAESTTSRSDEFRSGLYRFRGHAEKDFWRWVCSWSRSIRKPSDLGFSDDKFILPKLITTQHVVKATTKRDDFLFDMPAVGLAEQRAERSRTIRERCELAARIVEGHKGSAVSWCHLNTEGDLLERLIAGAVQISGKDSDDEKEEKLLAFSKGEITRLVTKSSITGFGLNWQFCDEQTHFPNHSFEQYYQSVRRSWRFGQKKPVHIDIITSEGESNVLKNLERKQNQAEDMFSNLVTLMGNELNITKQNKPTKELEIPIWL